MNILNYLEVILEDQATLYALIRSLEDRFESRVSGIEVPDYFEIYQKDWLEETKARLERVANETDDLS